MIAYGSKIVLRNFGTFGFLNSHPENYPRRYPDDRISSEGQHVTLSDTITVNNWWKVLPETDSINYEGFLLFFFIFLKSRKFLELRDTFFFIDQILFVKSGDYIRLQHVKTGGLLVSHDVASPLTATHMEVAVKTPGFTLLSLSLSLFESTKN